jgi:hypothetical protein
LRTQPNAIREGTGEAAMATGVSEVRPRIEAEREALEDVPEDQG